MDSLNDSSPVNLGDLSPANSSLKLKNCLETQLTELEMLQSMFCQPGEIRLDDPSIIADMTDYFTDKSTILPPYLDYTINLAVDNRQFELCATLPHDYPEVEPDIFVRNNELSREGQREINNDLTNFVKELERGDICIFSAITWLQDNGSNYVNLSSIKTETVVAKNNDKNSGINECARYWIYSHHIYSRTKRREILHLAEEYCLTGFCLPGKPGVICVEGLVADCNSWWLTIKAMSWKRIVCKYIEKEVNEDVDSFRKYKKFEELSFQCEGNRGNHMSLGDLLKYLEAHNCTSMFKELFGLDGKITHE